MGRVVLDFGSLSVNGVNTHVECVVLDQHHVTLVRAALQRARDAEAMPHNQRAFDEVIDALDGATNFDGAPGRRSASLEQRREYVDRDQEAAQ